MNLPILNDMILSNEIKDAFFNLDSNVSSACDAKAREICVEMFPDIDFTRQENIDLVIRPLSAVIAMNEIILQNLFSESTIDGIKDSRTIPSGMKSIMLKNFAKLNGISTVSTDPESLYSEIVFFLNNNNITRKEVFSNSMISEFSDVDRLFFADSNESEMVRNLIPYVQIDHLKVMNFSRSEYNMGTLVGTGYSRDDYQRYQDYKKSERVRIPGVLDVYFSTMLIKEDIVIDKVEGKYFILPEGYYISATTDKQFILTENDIMSNGIVKSSPRFFIPDGGNSEIFSVTRYIDPEFENYSRNDDFEITDVMTKGFYPLFINLEVFSRTDVDENILKKKIEEYFSSVGGNISDISINDMQNFLTSKGITVTVSPRSNSTLFSSTNMGIQMDTVFPLSVKDIQIPPEIDSAPFTSRTIRAFVGEVNVTKE